MTTVADLTSLAGQLPELIRHVQQGNEVIVTQASQPVARIVPITKDSERKQPLPPLKMRSFARPKVLTPNISRAEIAEDMFRYNDRG